MESKTKLCRGVPTPPDGRRGDMNPNNDMASASPWQMGGDVEFNNLTKRLNFPLQQEKAF